VKGLVLGMGIGKRPRTRFGPKWKKAEKGGKTVEERGKGFCLEGIQAGKTLVREGAKRLEKKKRQGGKKTKKMLGRGLGETPKKKIQKGEKKEPQKG